MSVTIEERVVARPVEAPADPVAATVQGSGASAQLPREYLSFRLGAEDYGIDILRVQEIRSYEAPTRIAGAPPFVKGVLNLRGEIVPILDLRLKVGCDTAEFTASTVVIVLNLRARVVGVVVDSVSDVLTLEGDQIKPVPSVGVSVDRACILGVGCVAQGHQQRMLILVDIDALVGRPHTALEG